MYPLGKTQKLLHSSDFSHVFDPPPYKASHSALLILAKPSELSYPRLGLVVSKKNIRLAADRNRFKRIVRESFRLKQHQFPPIDAIVLARRGADQLDNKAFLSILEKQWQRIIKKAQLPL